MAAAKKKSAAKQGAAGKPGAKRAAASKSTGAKKSASSKRSTAAAKSPAKSAPPSGKSAKTSAKKASTKASTKGSTAKSPAKKSATKSASTKGAPAKQASSKKAPAKQAPAKKAPARSAKKASSRKPVESAPAVDEAAAFDLPKPRFNKDGLGYTKDYDLSFVKQMHDALQDERVRLTGQARRLEDEAHQLVEEAEMGDVQFDDEGGEGDTMVVERERDLALSAQAREAVAEIDAALVRMTKGTYGYSIVSGRPIPRERLEAIPWSTELVEEKVGGIGRR